MVYIYVDSNLNMLNFPSFPHPIFRCRTHQNPRLLASHYMIAIAYHVTLEETEVGKAAFGSVLVPRQVGFRRGFHQLKPSMTLP